jgi:osmotically-inducible protein OsmY
MCTGKRRGQGDGNARLSSPQKRGILGGVPAGTRKQNVVRIDADRRLFQQRSMIMTLANRFAVLFFGILLLSFQGCASTPTQEGTGEYFDDSVITSKVKFDLLNEPSLKSFDIHVETFKGRVLLSGFVGSQADIDKAGEVARKVKGVVDVKNDLQLK